MRDRFSAYRQRSYKCKFCEVLVFKICSSSCNFYVFVVHQNIDLSDKMFYSLLTAMA